MTALEEIKKVLEAAEQFIVNGVELGYIRMPNPETPDSAHDTLPMIRQAQTALESLKRENAALREENDSLLDENSDLRNAPWPEWAKAVLKVVRSHTGYDGYDDATEGVDMPLELEEHLSELQSVNERLQSRAEAAEDEVKRLCGLLDGLCAWMLHRFGPDSPEGREAASRMASRTALASTGDEHHAE